MDTLKRELAPISEKAWDFIDSRAVDVLKANLSARKFMTVRGPLGPGIESISTGRMIITANNDMPYGVYKVKPLVEQRLHFKLNRWELDNIDRGALDVDTTDIDKAMLRAARFEEDVIFNGLVEADIEGLNNSSEHDSFDFGDTYDKTMAALLCATSTLNKSFSPKPYALVVSPEKWAYLNMVGKDSEFIKNLQMSLNLQIIVSQNIKNAFLLPIDNENFEITLGQDFAIGYQNTTSTEVELYVTSSFTFRVLDPTLLVIFK